MFSSSMANYTVLTCPIYHNVHSYCMLYESSVANNDDDDDNDNNGNNNKWLLLVLIIIHCTHCFFSLIILQSSSEPIGYSVTSYLLASW